jgi:maltose-binding protein MalE
MEPNKKQTAVEWLIEELFKKIDYTQVPQKLINQAKEMEEEQHKETFKQSRQAKIFEKDMPPVWESFEQYYNETYKGGQ